MKTTLIVTIESDDTWWTPERIRDEVRFTLDDTLDMFTGIKVESVKIDGSQSG